MIALRFLIGMGEGTSYPALSVLLSEWVPLKERAILSSLAFGGGQVCNLYYSTRTIQSEDMLKDPYNFNERFFKGI